jgi:hypothetical protein
MKKLLLYLFFSFFISLFAPAQQYGWKNITANLPKFFRDTSIINGGADTIVANISGISFIDDSHGWICTYHPFFGDFSAVLETTDGGQTWTEHTAPQSGHDIYMIDSDTGYFGAYNGMVFKTTDGAKSWTYHGHLMTALYDLGFPPRPASSGYAGGKDGHLAQITPEGVVPVPLGLAGSVYCISFPSVERGYALLDYQMIIFYKEGAWHVEANYPYSSKNWLFFYNDQLGWCVGDRFLKTTDGIDWIQVSPNTILTGSMTGVFFTDQDHGWAVGTKGQIFYSNNSGGDWTMLEHNLTDGFLNGVFFTSPTNGYIYGGEKILLKYGPVSGTDEEVKSNFIIYPNPTSGQFTLCNLVCATGRPAVTKIELADLFGKTVLILFEGKAVTGEMKFDAGNLPAGVYMLKIFRDESIILKKILKL